MDKRLENLLQEIIQSDAETFIRAVDDMQNKFAQVYDLADDGADRDQLYAALKNANGDLNRINQAHNGVKKKIRTMLRDLS